MGHPLKRGGFSRCTYTQPYAFRAAFSKWSAMRHESKKLPWATAHRELGPRGRAADQAAWQLLVAHVPREPGAAAGEPQPGSRSRGAAAGAPRGSPGGQPGGDATWQPGGDARVGTSKRNIGHSTHHIVPMPVPLHCMTTTCKSLQISLFSWVRSP